MNLTERVQSYLDHFKGRHPANLFCSEGVQILGTWRFGNTYKSDSNLYGAYPTSYLERIAALFPDKKKPLHIFAGNAGRGKWLPGDTVDVREDSGGGEGPTYVDDCQTLEGVPLTRYDLILADPPYSVEDAEHYQVSMVKRNKVMRALGTRVLAGTHVVWLDQVLPMYRKAEWDVIAMIGLARSTNHRIRMVTIFERNNNDSNS